jgi:hypothetical protein
MVTDYEAAWRDLQALVAAKTQHGREGLLVAMAEVEARHAVPAGELSRLLRLYGVEVERARSIEAQIIPDSPGDFGGGAASPADAGRPGHHVPEEGHDGSTSAGTAGHGRAVAGRR